MRLELQASPEEIREKSGQLLERLGEMLSSEVPEIAEMLEKALPKKEQELKYPVLQELAARTRELYAHQLDLMLQEIADVVIGGIGAAEEEGEPFGKALFIGPHGGKWADSAHTIHWTGDQPVSRQAPEPEAPQIVPYPEAELKDKLIEIGDALYAMQHGMHNVIDDTGFNHYDFGYWHSVRGNISGMKNMLKKYKGQIASHFGAEAYLKCGLHLVEKPKTSGFSIQPQYHDTFGSLYLPLNGFLKNDFKEYCEVQKKYGGIYDGNKKAFAISKLKLASFDFAAYKKDMAKFGIEVLEPLGTPAKATGPTAGEALTGDKIEEYIKGINAHQVTDVIVVRQRPDGIFEFYAPYAPAFNTLFANKGGQISGITKYNPVTHARETFDLELTEEAIGKLTVLFPKWQIMTHGVKEARIKRDQDIAELQKPIPEVQAKLGPDLKLMSFQNECVRFLDKANGNALIGDEMGLGKALVNQTLTLTPKGWRRFGDLQVGDEVIDPVTGAAVRVSGVYPQGQRKVWTVKTRDGEVVECDAEHLWHVYTAMDRFRENEGKVRTTAQLLEEGMRTGHGKGQYRWYLPVALPQEFEYRGEFPIDPYVLGVLIGDGAIGGTSVSWTKPDMEIVERVDALLPAGCAVVPRKVGEGDCPTWGISGINGKNPVLDSLRELGLQGCLSPEKFIPERYLYASIEDREQLLAGLMDTDGDTPIGSCCIYSTSSRRLADDVIFLARSLGAIASLSIKRAPRYQHNGETRIGMPSYRVNIRAAFNPYSLARKAEHWEASSLARAIVDICPSEREEEMRCIAVESLQSTFIVQGHVVTHNTIQTLAWAAKNDKRVLVVCPKVVRRNWLEEAEKFFPNYFHGVELVAADLKKGKVPDLSGINIAAVNYESLAKFEATIAAAGFDTIVIDECFGPETLVDTPRGQVPIAQIQVGDEVYSAVGISKVTGIGKRRVDGHVVLKYGGQEIRCSPCHPFFTDRGWVPAERLTLEDRLAPHSEAMRLLFQGVHDPGSPEAFLRVLLRCEVEDDPVFDSGQDFYARSFQKNTGGQPGQEKSGERQADAREKSYAPARGARKGFRDFATYAVSAIQALRKWLWPDSRGELALETVGAGVEAQSRGGIGQAPSWLSDQLQAGSGLGIAEARRRSGWLLAFCSLQKGAGPQERAEIAGIRLDGIEVPESGSYPGNEAGLYYDLRVAGHPSYCVNGVLVHNSHRMKNPKAQATQHIQKIGEGMKHHILLSGTAVKNKKEELFTQLEMVAPGKFTKNAIKTAPIGGLWMDMHEVYIARQKTAVLKDLPEKTTSIVKHPVPGLPDMGEQNTIGAFSKLKAEIAKGKVPVTESMVQEILDTSDSKVIVFSDSVEAAKAIAEKFGDLAILHHGQMQDDAREAAKKEFQKKDEAGNFIGEKRVFVTTRQSMAVGATLTAADKVVFNDMPWTAADVRQAEDRAHRIGQKNAVNVYWMTAEGNLFDENVNDILRRKYELGQKLTQGKQLTAAEMEWMSKPISVDELLTQIHGKVAGPTAGGGAESAETSQVPALSDMDHPELAPNLPEPQTAGTEILPGSATVVEVPWQGVPSPSSGVDKPLTVEMFDKLAAEVKKESATPYVVDPAGIAASLEQAQKDTDTITAEYSGKLNSLAVGTTIHLGYGQSFTKVEIGGDVFWAWEGKGGKKKGYLASEEAYVQMGAKAVDTAVSAGKKPAPAPAYVPEPTAAPEKALEVAKPIESAKPAVATPEPAPAPKLAPEQGSVPAQAFSGFIQEHGIKIKEHYGDPTKVMVKVPKHATEALAQLQKYGIAEPTFEGGQYHLVAVDKQKVKDLLFQKSLDDFLELDEPESAQLSLFKAGMFVGPRGGKWADPEHTIPWREEGNGGGAGAQPAPTPQAQTPQPPPQMGAPTPAAQIAPQMQSAPRAPQAGLTPPAGGDPLAYQVDPMVDADGDGVADAARVGLPGKTVAPPPTIPRLPNLTAEERAVEGKFADAFEADSDGMASAFYDVAKKNNFIFETDAAKSMMPEWTRPDLPPDEKGKPIHPDRAQARALYNTALHQTANAVAKRAFIKRLDEIAKMPEGERKILVTSGGVAGGKGSALGARPELAQSVAATWDAAGEQNGTENPWLMEECEKRGIKPVFLFVSADPMTTWPGAVDRAKSIGRMVDARLFADSYAHGAKNFSAFHSKNKDKATFVFAKAKKGDPVQFLDQMPPEALSVDADALYGQAMQYIKSKAAELPPHIVSGATAGSRIWGGA